LAEVAFSDMFLRGKEASLKYVLKSSLLAALFLACCAALPAQRFISVGSFSSFNYGGGYGGYGYSNYGWGGGYGGWGFYDSGLHHPEEHAPFGVGFAHGDPDFVPSTYMDYNKALELGEKILAEQSAPPPSLGEIARRLRKRARNYVPPPAPGPSSNAAPLSRPAKFIVLQDSDGRPILCRISNPACRNAA
jgi:hypothetical protein